MSYDVSTFVFFDIETTGLPFQERNGTKITELSMVAVSKEDILNTALGSIPRVSKLTLVFNPQRRIHHEAVKLNGLTNKLLKSAPLFKDKFSTIHDFLNNLPKPVCLIAHNGNVFDYKILLAECNDARSNLPMDLLCYDSIIAFRTILKDKNICHKSLMTKNEYESDIDTNIEEWPDLDLSSDDLKELDILATSVSKEEKQPKRKRLPRSKLTKNQLENRNKVIENIFKKKDEQYDKSCFKLEALYNRLLDKTALNTHRAETDCLMLLECVISLKHEFIPLLESSCSLLSDISPLIRY